MLTQEWNWFLTQNTCGKQIMITITNWRLLAAQWLTFVLIRSMQEKCIVYMYACTGYESSRYAPRYIYDCWVGYNTLIPYIGFRISLSPATKNVYLFLLPTPTPFLTSSNSLERKKSRPTFVELLCFFLLTPKLNAVFHELKVAIALAATLSVMGLAMPQACTLHYQI